VGYETALMWGMEELLHDGTAFFGVNTARQFWDARQLLNSIGFPFNSSLFLSSRLRLHRFSETLFCFKVGR
jgi:hypothetical protein